MDEKPRRTYTETYFWLFVLCILITVVSEFTGVSVKEMTTYADDMIKKTFQNMNSLVIWIAPIAILIKKEVSEWRKSMHARDIEIAKLKK